MKIFNIYSIFFRDSLKEAINLANSEELNCIASNASIFIGHLQILMGQYRESFDRIKFGGDIADKMPDSSLKSYAYLLYKGSFILSSKFKHT